MGEFDEAYLSLTKLESLRVGASVRQLNQLFQEMTDASDQEWVWSTEVMRRDLRWERVRALAAAELARLGVPLQRVLDAFLVFSGSSFLTAPKGVA